MSDKIVEREGLTLKDCPFCGCPAMMTGGGTRHRYGQLPFQAKCSSLLCFATMREARTVEKAAEIWNKRY